LKLTVEVGKDQSKLAQASQKSQRKLLGSNDPYAKQSKNANGLNLRQKISGA
jgi:hypothetical protein